MLNPDTRHLLTDALRPPPGWRIDAALATTYTLDLASLLLAPLSMAAYDQGDGIEGAAQHELLEAIRRYAERTTVFCQAGGIHVPGRYRSLTVFAEDSVVEVTPPPGRVFHPKVWLLRFANPAGELTHRLMVLSRNLTGDRSWDTVFATDEAPIHEAHLSARPLSRFIDALTSMNTRPMSSTRRALVEDMSFTVRDRSFALPNGFTSGRLLPLGVGDEDGWPMAREADKAVVISPFLDVGTIRRLPKGTTIISRSDAFDRIGGETLDGHQLFVLQPHADAAPEDVDGVSDGETTSGPPGLSLEIKTGLHAKVLAWDREGIGHLLTGSANATSAAFGGNVEFGVLLEGRPHAMGAAALLKDSEKETGLLRIVQPYAPPAQAQADREYDLERAIEELHVALAGARPQLRVSEEGSGFEVRLGWLDHVELVGESWVRPITLRDLADRPLSDEVAWVGLGHNDLTPFVAVRTQLERDGTTVERASVIRADLLGAPADRARRVLRELLTRVEDILRYLALLLQDPSMDDLAGQLLDASNDDASAGAATTWTTFDDLVLLEPLVRAYARGDDSLDRVERLLDDLRDEEGRLPELGEEFDALWNVLALAKEAR
ncbi:phospholipase D family protein [Nocardioides sp. J2M5]|uniref:phospholipase D family protein n=1 Tax=Nocardioides palaemonis TaxID=2829810 RepID=UPI001BA485EC|nr:phospholipase D family protein [Nocardioides palaemonis]MBS2936583.1 phospholipase D family protein [Nocardioides palaemonis]